MHRNYFGLAVVAVVGIATFATSAFAAEHTKDTAAEVKKAIENDKAVLVDVREADEWQDGHLKGVKHIALSDLKAGIPADKLKELIPGDKVVYLHCASGQRCLKAAELLKAAGYEVRPLKSGYNDLLKAGFEIAK